jgi:hypothetical protein
MTKFVIANKGKLIQSSIEKMKSVKRNMENMQKPTPIVSIIDGDKTMAI